jgi:hypothetical protein
MEPIDDQMHLAVLVRAARIVRAPDAAHDGRVGAKYPRGVRPERRLHGARGSRYEVFERIPLAGRIGAISGWLASHG